jgi:small subunit ribosomal protein S5
MSEKELKIVEEEEGQQASPPELRDKLVHVMRTAKVVKGGRIFKFTAVVVVGNGQGQVGFGVGKASEVPAAIKKATEVAKMSMVQVALNDSTLQYALKGHHGASRVFMRPATEGTGVIAGGPMRAVFEVMGVGNVLAKTIGSGSPINIIMATLNALKGMEDPRRVARRRGLSVQRVLGLEKQAAES